MATSTDNNDDSPSDTVIWHVCCGSTPKSGHRVDCCKVNPVLGEIIEGQVVGQDEQAIVQASQVNRQP